MIYFTIYNKTDCFHLKIKGLDQFIFFGKSKFVNKKIQYLQATTTDFETLI